MARTADKRKTLRTVDDPVLRRYIRRIRRAAQLERGVRICWRFDATLHAQGFNGTCEQVGAKRFVICICPRLVPELAWQTLIHEMAHVLQWLHGEQEHHGPVWGMAFARLHATLAGDLRCPR